MDSLEIIDIEPKGTRGKSSNEYIEIFSESIIEDTKLNGEAGETEVQPSEVKINEADEFQLHLSSDSIGSFCKFGKKRKINEISSEDSIMQSSKGCLASYTTPIRKNPNCILDTSNWISESDNGSSPLIRKVASCSTANQKTEQDESGTALSTLREIEISHRIGISSSPLLHKSLDASTPSKKAGSFENEKKTRKVKKSKKSDNLASVTKKELNALNKSKRKKEDLLSEMKIYFSAGLQNSVGIIVPSLFVNTEVAASPTDLPMIFWKRKVKSEYDATKDIFVPCEPREELQKVVVIYLEAQTFFELLVNNELESLIENCRSYLILNESYALFHFVLMIEGYQTYLNKIKNMEEKKYKRAVLETLNQNESNLPPKRTNKNKVEDFPISTADATHILNKLQFKLGFNFFPIKSSNEGVEWLHSFTYSISTSIYDKYERNSDFSSVSNIKSGTDAKATYFESIRQFRLMTFPKISRLYQFYQSIPSLFDRFQSKDSLGKDSSNKSVVPPSVDEAMKIYFTSDDPDTVIQY